MLRALLWKEWREQRALLLAGLGVATALPLLLTAMAAALQPGTRPGRVAEIVPVIFALFLWPFFALAAGSSSFAGETDGDGLGFLLSRPVRRRSVWLVKVSTRAASTGLLIAGTLAIAACGMWLAGIPPRSESALASLGRSLGAPERAALGPPALYLLFTAAAFFSAGRVRALAAAGLALVGSGLIVTAVPATWPLVALEEDFLPLWTGGLFALAATLLLVGSARRFGVAGAGGVAGGLRTAATFLLVVVVTLAAGSAPSLWADVVVDLDRAVAQEIAVGPGGEPVVVGTAVYPVPLGPLWRVDAAPPGAEGAPEGAAGPGARLTRGLAFNPFVSPDGAWVHYFALPRLPGLAGGRVDLRAVRPDGTGDRLVAADAARLPEVLVHVSRWDGDAHDILRHRPDDGETTTILSLRDEARTLYFPELSRAAPRRLRSLPVHLYRMASFDETGRRVPPELSVHLLDVETGDFPRIARLPCGFSDAALSADGTLFAWESFRSCREDEDGDLEGAGPVLDLLDLATGESRRIELDAHDLATIHVSPGGRRVLVTTRDRDADGSGRILVLDGSGDDAAPRQLDVRRFVDGVSTTPESEPRWVDDRHVLLVYASARPSGATAATLVVLDVVEGVATRVYRVPRAGWRLF